MLNRRGHRQMIRHRRAARNRNHEFARHITMLGERVNQRAVAIRVVAIQINVVDCGFKLRERKIKDSAQGEIVFHLRARLGPAHVGGLSVHLVERRHPVGGSRASCPHALRALPLAAL